MLQRVSPFHPAHFVAILVLALSPLAHAQVYQCTVDGKSVFQDSPCDKGATTAKTLAVHGSASADIDWSGLKYGMSLQDVQLKMPSALNREGGRLATGAQGKLHIDKVWMAGLPFEADFYFNLDKFAQVNLSGQRLAHNKENLQNFEKVCADFREKYGKESKNEIKNDRWGVSADAHWLTKEGKIWASLIPVSWDTSQLAVGYVPNR